MVCETCAQRWFYRASFSLLSLPLRSPLGPSLLPPTHRPQMAPSSRGQREADLQFGGFGHQGHGANYQTVKRHQRPSKSRGSDRPVDKLALPFPLSPLHALAPLLPPPLLPPNRAFSFASDALRALRTSSGTPLFPLSPGTEPASLLFPLPPLL